MLQDLFLALHLPFFSLTQLWLLGTNSKAQKGFSQEAGPACKAPLLASPQQDKSRAFQSSRCCIRLFS